MVSNAMVDPGGKKAWAICCPLTFGVKKDRPPQTSSIRKEQIVRFVLLVFRVVFIAIGKAGESLDKTTPFYIALLRENSRIYAVFRLFFTQKAPDRSQRLSKMDY
jgi:hypothetical protein